MSTRVQVVWYKRDLRVDDHRPLARAAERGPVLPLYVAEPSVAAGDDYRPRHWTLIRTATELTHSRRPGARAVERVYAFYTVV